MKLNFEKVTLKKPLRDYQEKINRITDLITTKKGPGGDYLGWDRWPETYDKAEFQAILDAAKHIRSTYEVFVVVGIGGSYLGARAVIEALNGLYGQQQQP